MFLCVCVNRHIYSLYVFTVARAHAYDGSAVGDLGCAVPAYALYGLKVLTFFPSTFVTVGAGRTCDNSADELEFGRACIL